MQRNYISGVNALVFLVLLSTVSCEPIYIPDPIDPRLPKYTESGNNVAGALINDKLWKSESYFDWFWVVSNDPSVFYLLDGDSVSIQFRGNTVGEAYGYGMISFGLKNARVKSLASLQNLEGRKFELGNNDNAVTLETGSGCNQWGTGQIYFRSVKYSSARVVATISGTFGFDIVDPVCGNLSVTYGRFDMEISRIQGI